MYCALARANSSRTGGDMSACFADVARHLRHGDLRIAD